jgi:hypothetical protein
LTTSKYFAGLLPILNSNRCLLVDNKRLAAQLCLLERRTSRLGGKDVISHPVGGHDELAASVAGLIVRLVGMGRRESVIICPPVIIEGMARHNPFPAVGANPFSEVAASIDRGCSLIGISKSGILETDALAGVTVLSGVGFRSPHHGRQGRSAAETCPSRKASVVSAG